MTTKELAERLGNLPDDLRVKLINEMPLAIQLSAYNFATDYLKMLAEPQNPTSVHDALMFAYVNGYLSARAEDRINLEDIFLNN